MAGKFDAAVEDISERHATGQPILVGTISVEQSETLSRLLDKRGVHARGVERQAARAGGADHRPGRPARRRHGRDEHGRARRRHPARRQPRRPRPPGHARATASTPRATSRGALQGARSSSTRSTARSRATRSAASAASSCSAPSATRAAASTTSSVAASGRQGDPGESRFYLSLEDELMRLFATGLVQRVMGRTSPTTCPLESKMVTLPSNARRARSRTATSRSARTCSSTTR